MNNDMDRPGDRDLTDIEMDVMLDLEFLRSNPSDEVMRQYAMDQFRAAAHRDAKDAIRRMRNGETTI